MERVQQEVHHLPTLYQSIFIMHYFHNTPLEEVAQRLGRPLGTVKVYLHRARKLLYKRLTLKARRALLSRGSLAFESFYGWPGAQGLPDERVLT